MKVTITVKGMTPYVQHNPRLADKTDPIVQAIMEINAKKSKVTDVEALKREELEFLGGLYHDPEIGIYVTSNTLIRAIEEAAKITRNGKAVSRALSPVSDRMQLIYDGPKTPEKLWKDPTFRFRTQVKNQKNMIMRMRPMFRTWGLVFEGEFLEDAGVNKSDFVDIVSLAGRTSGIGDARKLGYGRFTAEVKYGNGTV